MMEEQIVWLKEKITKKETSDSIKSSNLNQNDIKQNLCKIYYYFYILDKCIIYICYYNLINNINHYKFIGIVVSHNGSNLITSEENDLDNLKMIIYKSNRIF